MRTVTKPLFWVAALSLGLLAPLSTLAQMGPPDTPMLIEDWRVDAGSVSWLGTNNTERGGSYNPATGHILVASRATGVNAIVIVDGATGDSLGVLDMTGVSGGIFPFSEIDVTEDGQIFAANLQVGASETSPVKIYHWADEDSAPTVAYNGTNTDLSGRYGDSFAVEGSGTDVWVYLSGSGGQENIVIFDWDGTSLTIDDIITPVAGDDAARYGIAPIPGEDAAWINEPGSPARLIDLTDGSVIAEVSTELLAGGHGDIAYFEEGGFSFIATGPDFGGKMEFRVLAVGDPDDPAIVGITDTLNANPNGNATGFVEYDADRQRLIVLATNNALVSYDLTPVEPPFPPMLASEYFKVEAGTVSWLGTGNTERGGTFNPATGHILVASRATGVNAIVIVDSETGDSLGVLDMTGVAGGIFPFSEIAATWDGQIYAANLQVSAGAGVPVKIYRWADESSMPTLVVEDETLSGRYGDSFAVGGMGDDVDLFISGSTGQEKIQIYNWNGTAATSVGSITPVPGDDAARYGIAAVPGEDMIWINEPGSPARLVDITDGNVLATVGDDVISEGNGDITFFTLGFNDYIATGVDFTGESDYSLVNVTNPGMPRLVSKTMGYGQTPNGNATGFVAFDPDNLALVVLATNNALASIELLPENVAPSPAMITAPPDSARLVIEGDAATPFQPMWEASMDFDGDPILYTWELSATTDFSTLLVEITTMETFADLTFGDVDEVLEGASVAVGDSVWVYHRVIASDEEFDTVGPWAAAKLVRGEINNAPDEALIVAPDDGASVVITGEPTTEFTARWSTAEDADDDPVTYIWQLSLTTAFDEDDILVETDASADTFFTTTYRTVADILDGAGAPLDTEVSVYHRVITSDGSLETTGPEAEVKLTRSTLTGVETPDLPTTFALEGNYPNPFNPSTTLQMDLPQAAEVQVLVYDMLGRQVMQVKQTMNAGHNQRLQLDAGHLASGMYLYRVVATMLTKTEVQTGKMTLLK